jgi:ADP-ribose pyrophosphatase YjhB (NUDIX family)
MVVRGLQSYWRLTRAITLVAEACILDAGNQVALVEHTGRQGWSLPRTAVRKGEALEAALRRGLRDEFGIDVNSGIDLFWLYAEAPPAKNTQTGLFVVRQWTTRSPGTGLVFFPLDGLPAGLDPEMAARICQAVEGRVPFEVC